MCTEAFIPVCFRWILFENISCPPKKVWHTTGKISSRLQEALLNMCFVRGSVTVLCSGPVQCQTLKAMYDIGEQGCFTTG